ncbi:MAG: NDP-sugar synthase [Sulfolobales archaeon]|nr:NDP-sugar synthase [Sulfolobales archaeon]MDW8082354.1 NDP-sugar synthase [Sulfolobales archaeon]
MKAVVLAGGYATRLRPLTLTRPKPLLPILSKPLIHWLIYSLGKVYVDEIVISVKYLSNQIMSYLGNGDEYGVSIAYVEEDQPLGDAGPLKLVDEKVGLSETFLVLYGDIFTDVDIRAVVDFHKSKGALATLTAISVDNPERYGILDINEEGRVIGFIEKPTYRPRSNLANAGVYVFEPEVLKYIAGGGRKQKISIDLIPKILKTEKVYAYVHNGVWFDIGVPEDYLKANVVALNTYYPNGYVEETSDIQGEIVRPVYIGNNVVVGKGSIVGPNTLLLDNVTIGESSAMRGSIVMRGSRVGFSSYIRNSIIGENCSIGNWVRIESGVIIGDQVSIADEVFINRRNCVLPYKEISDCVWKEGEIIL